MTSTQQVQILQALNGLVNSIPQLGQDVDQLKLDIQAFIEQTTGPLPSKPDGTPFTDAELDAMYQAASAPADDVIARDAPGTAPDGK